MASQELRTFSSIGLRSEYRNLRGESFSIQGVSKWIHSLLPRPTGSIRLPSYSHYVLKRGGMVAPETE